MHAFSPIKVFGLEPLKSGSGIFKLQFYHANYPEGVRDKEYTLRTIERGSNYLLAKSIDHMPARIIYIHEITDAWMSRFFGQVRLEGDIQLWLDGNL